MSGFSPRIVSMRSECMPSMLNCITERLFLCEGGGSPGSGGPGFGCIPTRRGACITAKGIIVIIIVVPGGRLVRARALSCAWHAAEGIWVGLRGVKGTAVVASGVFGLPADAGR